MIGSSSNHVLFDSSSANSSKPNTKLRIAIEGNIASGKSSLLDYLSTQKDYQIFYEPLEEWQNVDGSNLIARMYEDPKRWGYLFQSYVLLTMMKQHHRTQVKPIAVMERSVYSARHCFVENLHVNDIIDDAEYTTYCQWYDYITTVQKPHLDLIVYLRTSPEVCLERIHKRARKEEKPVTLEYLQSLHDRHEEWLGDRENSAHFGSIPVLTIDANRDCTREKGLFEKFTKEMVNFSKATGGASLLASTHHVSIKAAGFH